MFASPLRAQARLSIRSPGRGVQEAPVDVLSHRPVSRSLPLPPETSHLSFNKKKRLLSRNVAQPCPHLGGGLLASRLCGETISCLWNPSAVALRLHSPRKRPCARGTELWEGLVPSVPGSKTPPQMPAAHLAISLGHSAEGGSCLAVTSDQTLRAATAPYHSVRTSWGAGGGPRFNDSPWKRNSRPSVPPLGHEWVARVSSPLRLCSHVIQEP